MYIIEKIESFRGVCVAAVCNKKKIPTHFVRLLCTLCTMYLPFLRIIYAYSTHPHTSIHCVCVDCIE